MSPKSKKKKAQKKTARPKAGAKRAKQAETKRSAKPSLRSKAAKKKHPKRKKISKPSAARGRKGFVTDADQFSSSRRVGAQRPVDLDGLSRAERADSESVEELVDEGNLFEAGAVAGVEEAEDSDEREVRTRELPEDDVPDEYLDKDQ